MYNTYVRRNGGGVARVEVDRMVLPVARISAVRSSIFLLFTCFVYMRDCLLVCMMVIVLVVRGGVDGIQRSLATLMERLIRLECQRLDIIRNYFV